MANNETALIVADNERIESALTKPDALDAMLGEIRAILDAFEPDLSTAKGRKEVASMASKVARSKTTIDGIGKDMVAGAKAKIKEVDNARKKARDTLDAWKAEVRKPLTEWEEERERSQNAIARLMELAQDPGETVDDIKATMDRVQNVDIDWFCPEHREAAENARDETMEKIRESLAAAEKTEAERKELEALRAEKEQREREEAEAARKAEAEAANRRRQEEQAAREKEVAENARKEAEAEAQRKIEDERRQREEAERRAAEAEARAKVEQERQAQEMAEAEAKRKADQDHVNAVMEQVSKAIAATGEVDAHAANRIADAIRDGKVPHVTIQF